MTASSVLISHLSKARDKGDTFSYERFCDMLKDLAIFIDVQQAEIHKLRGDEAGLMISKEDKDSLAFKAIKNKLYPPKCLHEAWKKARIKTERCLKCGERML